MDVTARYARPVTGGIQHSRRIFGEVKNHQRSHAITTKPKTPGHPGQALSSQLRGTGDQSLGSTTFGSNYIMAPMHTFLTPLLSKTHTTSSLLHPSNETPKVFNSSDPQNRQDRSLLRYNADSIDRAPSKARTTPQQTPAIRTRLQPHELTTRKARRHGMQIVSLVPMKLVLTVEQGKSQRTNFTHGRK